MTKPIEETWNALEAGGQVSVLSQHVMFGKNEAVADVYGHSTDMARAKLIAQAPAMARVLLAIEWRGRSRHVKYECPFCMAEMNREHVHDEDCLLDRALRKAGVR